MNYQKVCILGLGYIGLPTACALANKGVKVVGVDVNPTVVNSLQNGQVHLFEPGLEEVVVEALRAGNLVVSEQPEPADVFLIAVPTPFYDDKRADMSYVSSAAEAIVPHLRPGCLVLLESTSPPLTTLNLVTPILEKSGLKAGEDFYLAYSPERVLPGQIIRELTENDRVVGGVNPASARAARDLYAIFVRGEIVETDATTAEMVKLMENTYRDVNIAIANEFSRLANRFGVDVWEAISLANRHPRVEILRPGPGVGGHCISVDPWFLVESAPDLATLIRTARQVNDSQPAFAAALVQRALGGVQGKHIAALGLAFKPDVDDLRESPAIEVVHLLIKAGADVTLYEPFKPDFTLVGTRTAATFGDAVKDADALVLLVGHSELKRLDPTEVAGMTTARIAVDTVNGWDSSAWTEAGFVYHRLGVGKRHA